MRRCRAQRCYWSKKNPLDGYLTVHCNFARCLWMFKTFEHARNMRDIVVGTIMSCFRGFKERARAYTHRISRFWDFWRKSVRIPGGILGVSQHFSEQYHTKRISWALGVATQSPTEMTPENCCFSSIWWFSKIFIIVFRVDSGRLIDSRFHHWIRRQILHRYSA